jgi:GGDEF domain-containing protein
MAHVINQKMRREDLCGRLGHFQFVLVVSGSLSDGEKLVERIAKSSDFEFTSELIQWNPGETSLEILYRLDREGELTI